MKVRMTIEVEIDDSFYNLKDDEERMYLENEVLVGNGTLLLHSNDIGDTVGEVKKVTNIQYNP